ncbi:GATA transcription factor 12 [Acorus calamus]|uniref:GATA transcription factor n=1 Tax=Acorus calamus TaxID=4465 RepID=A0AAV9EJ55_ACOCL|nr:GATA transcription factor 12 [Acorus calamus]
METSEFAHCRAQFTSPEGRCSSSSSSEAKAANVAAAGGGEHFIVDDLLNFSNNEDDDDEGEVSSSVAGGSVDIDVAATTDAPAVTGDASTVTNVDSCNSSLSGGEFGLSGELCVPPDDLAELEWLSNFVEHSFSSEDLQKLHLISGIRDSGDGHGLPPPPQPAIFRPEIPSVPGKARRKRSRSSSSSAAASSWSSSRLLVLSSTTSATSSDAAVVVKKAQKKREASSSTDGGDGSRRVYAASSDGRRCLHCATDKTPQWRTGPMGPKTLCNACGVRYKSGRLVPEYRPAASPTFVLSMHSNSHRKVMELRRQKEIYQNNNDGGAIYEAGFGGGGGEDEYLIHHRIGPDFRQLI